MKKIFFILIIISTATTCFAQSLYVKTFGTNKSKPIIFLHGGPGYNCASFESTTAQRLADSGFFVIVYDRRGEGRSTDKQATYDFRQTFEDLDNIYKTYSLKQASLIGHSFGGIVATLFADAYPKKVNNIFLVGAPVSLQETYKNIIARCEDIYQKKKDSINLYYINLLKTMDTASLEYSTYCFGHAMQNGFYSAPKLSDETKAIYAMMRKDTLAKYASQMTADAPAGFWKKEHYTTIDLTNPIKKLLMSKINIYGLYGKNDGLYSLQQVEKLSEILGAQHMAYLDNCSHSVFIDQQTIFIDKLISWTKP